MTRRSGILLHPTSLPGPEGIGTIGAPARRFVDQLAAAGQTLWQMLPLSPPVSANCPYSGNSAFAGNPLLIDLADLGAEPEPWPWTEQVLFSGVGAQKMRTLRSLAAAFFAGPQEPSFKRFCADTSWLDGYATYMALRRHHHGRPWPAWRATGPITEEYRFHQYLQWQFSRQWRQLKEHANERGVLLVGDVPFYVSHESADAWARPGLFRLGSDGMPTVVGGVPPDCFSADGQLWGNPVYEWPAAQDWWLERLAWELSRFDLLRLDHFRGFESCWEVPAGATTAREGCWAKGPGMDLLGEVNRRFPGTRIIAEDLGIITDQVRQLLADSGYPGMAVLQFAFDSNNNPHWDQRENSVVYTGTHDNDTLLGWSEAIDDPTRRRACRLLDCAPAELPAAMIRTAMASPARLACIPLQDLIGSRVRMNTPGVALGNWGWRARPDFTLPTELLLDLGVRHGRC